MSKPKCECMTEPCHLPLRFVVATSQGTDPQAHPAEGEAPALPKLGSTCALPTLSCVWNFSLSLHLWKWRSDEERDKGGHKLSCPPFITDQAAFPCKAPHTARHCR
ncbi:Hypothetical predicted protein [Marmota monax]|uniref:Uncharacterized protein n=1 Tax=Marmota monax TaxID=9995 RepID=A0A5E4AI02_MARMO|nr:hypothetical protein GHT09_006126 [Marmota monax]VTJ56349.1 Hypothetical predicted protein [Marmota monax]